MSWGRFLTTLTAFLVAAGCAVVAINMANAAPSTSTAHHRSPTASGSVPVGKQPAFSPLPATTAAPTPSATTSAPRSTPPLTLTPSVVPSSTSPTARTTTSAPSRAASTPSPAASTHSTVRVATKPSPKPSATPTARPSAVAHHPVHRAVVRTHRLPLRRRTHHARQVITVVAHSQHSTTATVQAWRKTRSGWIRRGPRIHAFIGADGMTWHASESRSATPMGSFTLTRAFGHNRDPGTRLPYVHTNPSDWWISQAGPLYNTLQSCSSNCSFNQGDPNEHLYYETPYYDYAVVIDYNTRNAPGGVKQGRGSAFFLHVHPAGTGATAGCVAIPRRRLVSIMRWLSPAKHPRILIGTA